MPVIGNTIDRRAESFRQNRDALAALVGDLKQRIARAATGGSAAARERHMSRGKFLVRDRIALLLDAGSPFLELSQMAALNRRLLPLPGRSRQQAANAR